MNPSVVTEMTATPLGRTTLLDPEHLRRVDANRRYLMSLTNENLLQAFLLEAGRLNVSIYHWEAEHGKHHWGWESPMCQLRGHFLGHWLSAAAMAYASRGDEELRAKANTIVRLLGECQEENGGEWAGSIPEKYLDWVARKKRVWAPHYTLHKTFMGLLDMHRLAGSEQALDIAVKWAAWFTRWAFQFDREHWNDMLDVETGGMMEAFADLYAATGSEAHLALMRRYERPRLFERLLAGDDPLTNQHANTTVPEIHGAARAYELTGERRYRDICEAYWRCAVTARGFFCTGGQTSGEVWTPPQRFDARLGDLTQEHCVVYNMIRLADYLLRWTGEVEYADYIERNHRNGILTQQNPDTAMVAYFLPLRPGARKEWSTQTSTFTCCLGTVVQANAHHTGYIAYEHPDGVTIAQHIPSIVEATAGGRPVRLTLGLDTRTTYINRDGWTLPDPHSRPSSSTYTVKVECEAENEFELRLRLPWWMAGAPTLLVNGEPRPIEGACASSWLSIGRAWKSDTVSLELPRSLSACPVPDNPGRVAFMDGPVVLAGLTGGAMALVSDTDHPESRLSADPALLAGAGEGAPTLRGDAACPECLLAPDDERHWGAWQVRYRTRGQASNFKLVPLEDVRDEPYTVYFDLKPNRP